MQYLRAEFERPDLREGSRLPTVRELAVRLQVSVYTVQSVFQKLSREGRIRTEVGNGTFLLARPHKQSGNFQIALSIPSIKAGSAGLWTHGISGGILQEASRLRPRINLRPLSRQTADAETTERELMTERSEVDGLILFSSPFNDRVRRVYENSGKPVVDLNPPSDTATANFVSPDYFGASYQLGKAWKQTGRRHVVLLLHAPLEQSVSNRLRFSGLVNGLRLAADEPVFCRTVLSSSAGEEDGYQTVQGLLAGKHEVVDAVYCASDHLALGAVRALREHGLRVPEDVSVVGGTGLNLSDALCPELTSTQQPLEDMGTNLISMLCDRIKQDGSPIPGRILPTPFTGGGTTRPQENEILTVHSTEKEQNLEMELQ